MTFYCNAVGLTEPTYVPDHSDMLTWFQAVAMLAVMVLLFSHFLPVDCNIEDTQEEVDVVE